MDVKWIGAGKSVKECVIAESNGAVLVESVTITRQVGRRGKSATTMRCICPFLCDAASEPCEFDEINARKSACLRSM